MYKTRGAKNLEALDKRIEMLVGNNEEPVLIDIEQGLELLKLAYANLEFDDSSDDDRKAHIAALEHLSESLEESRTER